MRLVWDSNSRPNCIHSINLHKMWHDYWGHFSLFSRIVTEQIYYLAYCCRDKLPHCACACRSTLPPRQLHYYPRDTIDFPPRDLRYTSFTPKVIFIHKRKLSVTISLQSLCNLVSPKSFPNHIRYTTYILTSFSPVTKGKYII